MTVARSPFFHRESSFCEHIKGGYTIQRKTQSCSLDTMLATVEECSTAKAILDPKAPAVKSENYEGAPKGCSRHKGEWFFNTHKKGALDGASEPICRVVTGKSNANASIHSFHQLRGLI